MGFYTFKDSIWLENQRYAGSVLRTALEKAEAAISVGISTLELNQIVEDHIIDNKCIPTFKGYSGFPCTCCISTNNELVHGIPSDITLNEGDIVKIDSGATYNGAIADMARTYVVGNTSPKNKLLIASCKEALDNAIASFDKKPYRLGNIGYAIKKTASKINAKIVTDLTGHGLEINEPHWFPIVLNVGEKDSGIILYPNMTLCIEPMFTYGSPKIKIKKDGWTVVLEDIGVHFEDTIFVHEDFIEIITR